MTIRMFDDTVKSTKTQKQMRKKIIHQQVTRVSFMFPSEMCPFHVKLRKRLYIQPRNTKIDEPQQAIVHRGILCNFHAVINFV